MDKSITIVIVTVIVLAGGYFLLANRDTHSNSETNATVSDNTNTPSTTNTAPPPASVDTNNIIKTFMVQNMKIEVLKEGSGAEAKVGDKATVNYTGTLTDGTKFDSSLNPGRTPFQFTIGPDCAKDGTCVIEGWNLGVAGMKAGEKRKLTIPGELAYGAAGRAPIIPPNATLLFEIELLKIN